MLSALLSADLQISLYVNSFVGRFPAFDHMFHVIERNSLFKGMFAMMLFWGLWFGPGRREARVRGRLLATLAVAVLAVFVGRALAVSLPHRPRPAHEPELGFQLYGAITPETLEGWSSMPSDHAVLFFALATGIFLAHRAVGTVALLHAIFIISLPRVYFGLHYASDLVVGAAIGVLLALVLVPWGARLLERSHVPSLATTHGAVFYPVVFLATWQVAALFGPLREILAEVVKIVA